LAYGRIINMAALGGLIVYIFYAILILTGIVFLRLALIEKKPRKRRSYTIIGIVSICLLFLHIYYLKLNHRESELEYAGTYVLTRYPKCNSCILVLNGNNTYEVVNVNTIVENGNWHYESGGDYWIVYIGDNREQLGSGKYDYEHYKKKFYNR
jgi:hypothetical protein